MEENKKTLKKLREATQAVADLIDKKTRIENEIMDTKRVLAEMASDIELKIAMGRIEDDVKLKNNGQRQAYVKKKTKDTQKKLTGKNMELNKIKNEIDKNEKFITAMKITSRQLTSENYLKASENNFEAENIKIRSSENNLAAENIKIRSSENNLAAENIKIKSSENMLKAAELNNKK